MSCRIHHDDLSRPCFNVTKYLILSLFPYMEGAVSIEMRTIQLAGNRSYMWMVMFTQLWMVQCNNWTNPGRQTTIYPESINMYSTTMYTCVLQLSMCSTTDTIQNQAHNTRNREWFCSWHVAYSLSLQMFGLWCFTWYTIVICRRLDIWFPPMLLVASVLKQYVYDDTMSKW
jgi:hypothetical protein